MPASLPPAYKAAEGRFRSAVTPEEQIALVGPPNTGKSSLVAGHTHADPEVAPYPSTTREAAPGMMPLRNVAFQLVDLPPLSDQYVEGWVYDLIRAADLVWLILDVERATEGFELVRPALAEKGIELVPAALPGDRYREAPGQSAAEPEHRPGWAYEEALLVLTGIDRPDARQDLPLLSRL